MRLFIAIEIPEEIREKITKAQQELQRIHADIKWVRPENIHLTLRFLGEVSEDRLAEVSTAGDESIKGFSPFEIEVSGIGVFPNMNRPRVIWAGIGKGLAELEKLSEALSRQLSKIGFPEEKRKFVGHLTIGRVRSLKDKERLIKLSAEAEKTKFGYFQATSITLIKSQLTPAGPIYTVLRRYNFSTTNYSN